MARFVSRALRRIAWRFGYELRHMPRAGYGLDLQRDVERLLAGRTPCTVFDVGANKGKFTASILAAAPQAVVHAFEPAPQTFALLEERLKGEPRAVLNNKALGDREGPMTLRLHRAPAMNSFLAPGADCLTPEIGELRVEMTTVDRYCAAHGIESLTLLKTDAQGFDFQVLTGASGLIGASSIDLILCEVIFDEMYDGMTPFDELYGWLRERGYRIYAIYNQAFQKNALSWADILFISDRRRSGSAGAADA